MVLLIKHFFQEALFLFVCLFVCVLFFFLLWLFFFFLFLKPKHFKAKVHHTINSNFLMLHFIFYVHYEDSWTVNDKGYLICIILSHIFFKNFHSDVLWIFFMFLLHKLIAQRIQKRTKEPDLNWEQWTAVVSQILILSIFDWKCPISLAGTKKKKIFCRNTAFFLLVVLQYSGIKLFPIRNV